MSAAASGKPFENTRMAVFLRKRIDELAAKKSQREIAVQAGYEKPNIISMFKRGETKVPFDKVPVLAEALEVDIVEFLKLQLDQPGGFDPKTVNQVLGRMATRREERGVLAAWREATGDADPELTDEQLKDFTAYFKQATAKLKVVNAK